MSRRQPTPPNGPTFRSAAVARMAQMPVATLRIWEQRHAAVQPATAASGHRLYSAADVQRVLLLRRLTEQGHAIGSIAALDGTQLQQLAQGLPGAAAPAAAAATPLRVVVVGPALALRLQRPAAARAVRVVAVFDALAEAVQAAAGARADALFWHAPDLRPALPPELQAARKAWRVRHVAALYRFGAAGALQAAESAGVEALREPADDAALGAWLAALRTRLPPRAAGGRTRAAAGAQPAGGVAPRRFDDAALTAIAGLPPKLACECPRHVAELLMQLASFEAYSAGCVNRDAPDAELHAYLNRVAGTARTLFEAALERVARHEGLVLR